jgi:hypothetical protein
VRSFGGFLGAAIVGVVVAVAAGGCSRSELDLGPGPTADGGGPGADGNPGNDSAMNEEFPDGFVMEETAPPPSCGDGKCSNGETCSTCALDCGQCQTCGNGNCDTTQGESCTNCPMDCGACPSCGDGFCTMPQENCQNCPQDCGVCPGCGDHTCTPPNETCFSCPTDCGECMGCGDGICQASETCISCPMDCGVCSVCGNNKCEGPYETCFNCEQDCGTCPVKNCFQEITCAISCVQGGITNLNSTCIVGCLADGCPNAQYFVNQALGCIIGAALGGQCMGLDINCLMMACGSQISACIGSHC